LFHTFPDSVRTLLIHPRNITPQLEGCCYEISTVNSAAMNDASDTSGDETMGVWFLTSKKKVSVNRVQL